MDIEKKILDIVKKAKKASRELSKISSDVKEELLKGMAQALVDNVDLIIKANDKDLKMAEKKGLSKPMMNRLKLDKSRIENMSKCLIEISQLEDSLGKVMEMRKRPNGLSVGKLCVPIGVIGIIYESRPNVTSDCIGLCLKSGNSVVLRGGKESINSNVAVFKILYDKALEYDLPEGSFSLIDFTDREAVDILLKARNYVDLIIPRGGEGLIQTVTDKSKIPVIKHYKGICHTYVDKDANLDMALNICYNAKVQKPSVCNAMETMLVHRDIAKTFLPKISKVFDKAGVELRGDLEAVNIVKDMKVVTEEDWGREFLDLILSVKIVSDIQEALDHIAKYGSNHSDAIVTENYTLALKFLNEVDSACVYVNASTRFTDGNQFGLGAEMGVSTDKIHARGPMGVNELTTYKYIILGQGQIRE